MNRLLDVSGQPASSAELRAALETALGQHFGGPRGIVAFTREPSDYRSSYAMDELDVGLEDGTVLELMFKDVSWQALLEEAQNAKPQFLYDPLREIEVYRTILTPNRLGTAIFYGAVVNEERGHYWLFLERVPGLRLSHTGDFDTWVQVARSLAVMHSSFSRRVEVLAPARPAPWLYYDRDFYQRWMERAQRFVRSGESLQGEAGWRGIERVARNYDRVIERLLALPKTLIHGEFYASNILIHETDGGVRVCPVDWEMAAVAPGIMDLAALTCGNWTDEEKRTLAQAYHSTLEPDASWPPDMGSFLTALDFCQLHLAVQWLGWSLNWSPPPEQTCNWLSEALQLTEKLGL